MRQGLLSKFLFGNRIGRLLPSCTLSGTLLLRLGFSGSLSLFLCGFHILGFEILLLLLICLFGWGLLALCSRLSCRTILSSNLCPQNISSIEWNPPMSKLGLARGDPNIPQQQQQQYGWSCHTHIVFDLVINKPVK